MRVTESGILTLTARSAEKTRANFSQASDAAGSGVRVQLPSDDVAAWAAAQRARVAQLANDGRGRAIGHAVTRLETSERAVGDVQDMLARARELALQMTNGALSAGDRDGGAAELRSLRDRALAALNTRDADGSYIFGGAAATTPPFDASGAYTGGTEARAAELGPGWLGSVEITGDHLSTATVDLFQTVDAAITGLAANDPAAVRGQLDNLAALIDQASGARSMIGERTSALSSADDARVALKDELIRRVDRSVNVDMVESATNLARARNALDAAQTVAQQVMSILQRIQ